MDPSDTGETIRRRVLIVDDDESTSRLVRSWFVGQPYEFLEASDGESGLRLAGQYRPDLILLDLRMPGLDGISVARQLRAETMTRTIPVIVLTACRDVDSKVEAFAAGADDYITKPFEVAEVDARVRSMLRKREVLAQLERAVRDLALTNQRMEQLLMIDDKTGLYNFREFQRRLRDEWSRAERYGAPLSLVFFDIDHFKTVNDTLGHQAGDRLLQEFATLLTGGARANDVAARYGGEEFAVILPHTDSGMAHRVVDRIRRAVREFVFLEDESPTRITVSGGVATFSASADLDSVEDLVRAADRALYRAKDLGRDRVVRHRSATEPDRPARRRRALREGPDLAS